MIRFKEGMWTYYSDVQKISWLQRAIIIHSIIYYELNSTVITDQEYDSQSKQLVSLMKSVGPEEMKRTEYYYCMYDFDGSTGFDLKDRLNKKDKKRLVKYAKYILNQFCKESKK